MGEITVRGPSEGSVDRIERFQALTAGQYWRARESIPEEGIEAGTVLLIQSVRLVDEAPHTIILRPHPSKIGEHFARTSQDEEGHTSTRWIRYTEHRFLLAAFLQRFEFEPDAQRVRAQEVAEVQKRVQTLQTELIEAPRDPVKLAHIVEEGLQADAAEAARQARLQSYDEDSDEDSNPDAPQSAAAVPAVSAGPSPRVVQLARGTVSQALATGVTPELIEELKTAASREHQIATIKARWITGKTQEIAETIQALTPFYEEQAAAALAQTEDVRTYVDALLSGIASLDLYVGKGVKVETLHTGASAPAEVPLTLVQRKLLMDEELALWVDVDERFDFSREESFFEALLAHEGLVRQIFPTERCVLVMATTRRRINYGDAWVNAAKAERNKEVFLLARDGENLYRIFSPVESHMGAANLFPSADEQDALFRGLDGRQIKFEDIAYTDKLSSHEKFALHYKRFLLLLCGLDHRQKLFGEFYPGPASFDFVSLEFQERYMRFLFDDGGNTLGHTVQPLREWIREKNSYLRSGSRVLCNWRSIMNPRTAPAACRDTSDGRGRRGFYCQYSPTQAYATATVFKEGDELCVEVEVAGETRRRYEARRFKCKVYLSRVERTRWDYEEEDTLPFLVLDAVDPKDLETYIHRRDTRAGHLFYIRFFKTAIRYLQSEATQEAPARAALLAALEAGRIASGTQAQELINRAVRAWRAAHNGAALPAPASARSREWKSLLDQLYQLAGAADSQVEALAQYVRAQGAEPLRLVLSGDAKFWMYAAPGAAERDDRLEPHAFVHRIVLERTRGGAVRELRRSWVSLPVRSASETTVKEWPAAAEWAKVSSFFSTLKDKQTALSSIEGAATRLRMLAGPLGAEPWGRLFESWKAVRARLLEGRYVRNPRFALPFGLIRSNNADALRYLAIGHPNAHALLYRLAPDQNARAQLRAEFLRPYANKVSAAERFRESIEAERPVGLCWVGLKFRKQSVEGFFSDDLGVDFGDCAQRPQADPRINPWWAAYVKERTQAGHVIHLSTDLGEASTVDFDQLLGITLPADFEALEVREYELHPDSERPARFGYWFDLAALDAPEPDLPENSGYRSSTHIVFSREKARAYITKCCQDRLQDGAQLLLDREVPEAPPCPPEVHERWYVLDPPGAAQAGA